MDQDTHQAQDDGAAFLPVAQDVQCNGCTVTVQPLTVMQCIQISRTLKAVLPALDRLPALMAMIPDDLDGDDSELPSGLLQEIVALLADYGEPLTLGIAQAVGKPAAFTQDTSDLAGLFRLVAAVVKVNAGFFARQVAPYLGDLRAAATAGTGPMPSTPSAAPATT